MRMVFCAEAASDETGSLAYGQPGDQKQQRGDPAENEEVRIREIAYGDFSLILRYPDKETAKKIAEDAREIALNPNVGYAQYGDDKNNYAGRYGLWYAMHGVARFADIDIPCNCDCSALVADVLIHNGISCSRYMRTASEREELKKLGFEEIPYSLDDCEVGDVLWRQGHTAIVIEVREVNNEGDGMSYQVTLRSSTVQQTWATGAGPNSRRTSYVTVKRSELGFEPSVIIAQQVGEVLANTQWIRGQSHCYCANFENNATAGIAVGKYSGYFDPDANTIKIPVRFAGKDYLVKIY